MGKIMVNGENYSGSEVVANPTLAGSEAKLTGLEVDGTKYAVSGGGGGGVTKSKIYDNNNSYTFAGTINLDESIYDYDYILLNIYWPSGSDCGYTSQWLRTVCYKSATAPNGGHNYLQLSLGSVWSNWEVNNPQASGGDGDEIVYKSGTQCVIQEIWGVTL